MKTISSILKKMNVKNFRIVSTMGHIKDLPKDRFGLKIENGKIIPHFVFLPYKKKVLERIEKMLNNVDVVILATDPDREGEAISFHVFNELKKKFYNVDFKRAFINEITFDGLKRGIENLGFINYSMVQSQFARRIIDRIIGYKISPILWKNFKMRGLSAGRVQTATLKLIYDKEKEIENFKPQKFYTIKIKFKVEDKIFEGYLYDNNQVLKFFDKDKLLEFKEKVLEKIVGKNLRFDLFENEREIIPPDPLKTSTLQQEAAKLGISNSETMKIAQKLYEGVFVDNEKIGLITYHRTDSIRISQYGIDLAKKILGNVFIHKRKNKSMFDAHEAIRITTDIDLEKVKKFLDKREFLVYQLIYNRFLASLSPVCKYLHFQLVCPIFKDICLKYESALILDKGFTKFLPEYLNLKIFKNEVLNTKAKLLEVLGYSIEEDQTKPPARYTLSSIVKKMEEVGIGRPSTYASTVEILKKRKYIEVKKGSIFITDLGKKVIEFLFNLYPSFFSVDFTAHLEDVLDKIENTQYEESQSLANKKIWEIYSVL
mgnify:CR=1 FL=1